MGTKTGLAVAAAAIVVTLLAVSLGLRERPEEVVPPTADADPVVPSTTAAAAAPAQDARVEVPVEVSELEVAGASESTAFASVTGYVLAQDGLPLPSGASPFVGFVDDMGRSQSVRVAADGAFAVDGLAPGLWWIRAGSMGWIDQGLELDLRGGPHPEPLVFRLVERPYVDVRLLAPDGRPFWDVVRELGQARLGMLQTAAVATREPPGERFEGVIGSLNNRFGVGAMWWNGQGSISLSSDVWCRVLLYAEPPLFLSVVLYHDVVATQPLEPGQRELSFTLDPAAIAARLGGLEFTLVDLATGAPLAGAGAMLLGKGAAGPSQATDERGHARVEPLPPGLHDLRVFAPGLAEVRREVDVPRGEVLDLGTIEVPRAVPIRGRALVDDDEGLEVEIRMAAVPEHGERPDFGNHYETSKADGTFELATLPPGRWLLQIKDRQSGRLDGHAADWMAPNVIVDTRHGPVEELHVRLEKVAYLVADWTDADHEGVRLRFLDADGLQRQVGGFYGAGPIRVALYPGAWRVLAVDEQGAILCERAFELTAEDLKLTLAPGG